MSSCAMRVLLLFACALCLGVQAASAQAGPDEKQQQAAAEQARRRNILARVESYADRLASFDDAPLKIDAMTRIAETLCRCDQVAGRDLFLRSHNLLAAAEPAPANGRLARSDSRGVKMLDGARVNLLVRLRRCDASLWKGILESERQARLVSAVAEMMPLLQEASDALQNQDQPKAASLIEQALQQAAPSLAEPGEGGGAAHEATELLFFLIGMRRRNPAAADLLFIKAIATLRNQPSVDVRNLLALGAYLFTDSSLAADLIPTIGYSNVAGVSVVNLSTNRPGISPEAARGFLEAAAELLARPAAGPEQKKLHYAAAHQLLPKAREFLPDRVPLLEGTMQVLGSDVPAALRDSASYRVLSQENRDLEGDTRQKNIEMLPDVGSRTEAYLALVLDLVQRGRIARAREVLNTVSPSELKTQVEALVDFEEGAYLIGKNQLLAAGRIQERLPKGAARGMLRLGLAAARWENDKQAARAGVFAALDDARGLDDERLGQFLLAAAGVLGRSDSQPALEILRQAVQALNRAEAGRKAQRSNAQPPVRGFVEAEFRVGNNQWTFVYHVPGVPLHEPAAVVSTLAARDPDAAEAVVLDLQVERLLAEVLPPLAAAFLKNLPPAPKAPE